MELNHYIDLQKKVSGEQPEPTEPSVDHSSATNVALDMAKRQAEKPAAPTEIPSVGAPPVPN
jgi:hypothetical protein